jgi:imidazolonepropionase
VSSLLLRNISELCTCDARRGSAPGVVENAAVVARDGLIAYVGPEQQLPHVLTRDIDAECDCGGNAVLPGFVDAHTHAVWLGERSAEYAQRAAGRTYEEIAASGGGIKATVRATAAGTVDELLGTARRRVRRMLEHGTTTVEVKSGYGGAHDAEMRMLDAAAALRADPDAPDVVTTYLPLHATPDGDRAVFLNEVCERGIVAARSRAGFVDAFCDQGAFSVAECERVLSAAMRLGMRGKLHTEQLSHSGGAQLAARLGLTSADHLEHASDTDLQALAAAAVTCVILPGASLTLGGPPPPGRRVLDADATLAIATDCNPGTCYSESMPLMVSLAVATAGVTPAEALVAATAGGAAALSLRDRGMLREGMRCDAVVLQAAHWLDVAYHLGGDVVASVVRGGVVSYEHG